MVNTKDDELVLSFDEDADNTILVSIKCGEETICATTVSWEEVTCLLPTEDNEAYQQVKEVRMAN